MVENISEGMLVDVEPLAKAEEVCSEMVEVRQVGDENLLLDADPAMAEPICTVLAHKDVRVKRLRRAGLGDCVATNRRTQRREVRWTRKGEPLSRLRCGDQREDGLLA